MPTYFQGKIPRVFVNATGCSIQIEGAGDAYFTLQKDSDNYDSFYSLILIVLTNNMEVRVRTQEERTAVTNEGRTAIQNIVTPPPGPLR